jgi:hypothetical protein
MDLMRSSDEIKKIRSNPLCVRPAGSWVKPWTGSLKLNVDGSSLGKPGRAVIGGVLRDSNELFKCVFSNPIGIKEGQLWN